MQMATAQRCSGARAITAQRSPSTTCSGTGMAALELSQQSLTRGAGTGAARRAPSHCRQCSGPWQRWQQRSQYCAAELSLAQAASYASCDAAVTAALEPHRRSVRTSARASAAGGQHQWPAGSAPTVRQSQIERESGHKPGRPSIRIVKMRLAREQAKSHKIAARVRVPACNEQHARSVATRHRAGQDVYQGSPSALSAAAAGCWRRVAPFLGGF